MKKVVRLVEVEYIEKAQMYVLMDENEDVRTLEQSIGNHFDCGAVRLAWCCEEHISVHTRPREYSLANLEEAGELIYRVNDDGELEEVDSEDLVEMVEEEQQNAPNPNQLDLEM